MELSSYNLPQLRKLSEQISKEIEKRQKATRNALSDVMPAAGGIGANGAKKGVGAKPAKGVGAKKKFKRLPPKYRHPDDEKVTWSGKGRHPVWFDKWIEDGGSAEALEISKASKAGEASSGEAANAETPQGE